MPDHANLLKGQKRLFPSTLLTRVGSLLATVCLLCSCASFNRYQTAGTLSLKGLSEPVRVVRDEKGMAYIYAGNLADGWTVQGFVTAQDRLFQMELIRLFAQGRIGELAGVKAEPLDTRMRTIGFYRHARRQARILNPKTRLRFDNYLNGVNAFIETRPECWPLEFKLAGIVPTPWTVADSLAILYYMGWGSAANLKTEIIAQLLVDALGQKDARQIMPLSVNPDDPQQGDPATLHVPAGDPGLNMVDSDPLLAYLSDPGLSIGSNNWAASPRLNFGGKPVVANDPHLDARILPGPWYPYGLITPGTRAVGATIPGLPGMVIFRNTHVAMGITNAYGDAQDLFVETLDPDDPNRYREGDRSLPFGIIEETLSFRDKKAPGGFRKKRLLIRTTRRGPVVSNVLKGWKTDRVLTLRWSPFETMTPQLGLDRLILARSAQEVRTVLGDVTTIMLNFVFADTDGNIGWQTTGKLPIRAKGNGTLPLRVTDASDNWIGWIPFLEMPRSENPEKGWVGTCNHRTVGADYPYYYSSHMAPSYRYRRLKQLMESPGKKKVTDHWRFQQDTLNLMAKAVAPVMAGALLPHKETHEMGVLLNRWDHRDDPGKAAPAIFQSVYRHFALMTFRDELGEQKVRHLLDNPYFWQERLQQMVMTGTSPFFDDQQSHDIVETRDMLFYRAALAASDELGAKLGADPEKWLWGEIHRIEFVSPIRRKGLGKGLLGGGIHPVGGSGETLLRNTYRYSDPYHVTVSDSLRMVADLSDPDKVVAVTPGGVAGRLFHPHAKDQIDVFLNGEMAYWWFSDQKIGAHQKTELVLTPPVP